MGLVRCFQNLGHVDMIDPFGTVRKAFVIQHEARLPSVERPARTAATACKVVEKNFFRHCCLMCFANDRYRTKLWIVERKLKDPSRQSYIKRRKATYPDSSIGVSD